MNATIAKTTIAHLSGIDDLSGIAGFVTTGLQSRSGVIE